MCKECKNQDQCPYKEMYDYLCKPLLDGVNDGLKDENIFEMKLICNLRNKELPYTVDNTVEYKDVDETLNEILGR